MGREFSPLRLPEGLARLPRRGNCEISWERTTAGAGRNERGGQGRGAVCGQQSHGGRRRDARLYVRLIESCVRDGVLGGRVRIIRVAPGRACRAATAREIGGASASWAGWAWSRALAGTGVSLAQGAIGAGAAFWLPVAVHDLSGACVAAADCTAGGGAAAEPGTAEKAVPGEGKFVAHTKERASAIRTSSVEAAGVSPCPASRRLDGPAERAAVTACPCRRGAPRASQGQQAGKDPSRGKERQRPDQRGAEA